MDFKQFFIAGSQALRHDLISTLFIAWANLELIKEEVEEDRYKKINSQMEKAFSIMGIWKELEIFGEAPSWQELKTILLRVKIQSKCPFIKMDVQNVKINTNGLFHFVFTNLIDNSMRHGGKEDIKIRISSKIEERDLVIIYEDNGTGVPNPDKKRIFAQGFGNHTGLGMFFSIKLLN